MKQEITCFLKKTLGSRKFWATVAASGFMLATGDTHGAAQAWMVYVGIQGSVDAVEKFKGKPNVLMGSSDA